MFFRVLPDDAWRTAGSEVASLIRHEIARSSAHSHQVARLCRRRCAALHSSRFIILPRLSDLRPLIFWLLIAVLCLLSSVLRTLSSALHPFGLSEQRLELRSRDVALEHFPKVSQHVPFGRHFPDPQGPRINGVGPQLPR